MATAMSLAGHGLIVALLARELNDAEAPPPAPAIAVTLSPMPLLSEPLPPRSTPHSQPGRSSEVDSTQASKAEPVYPEGRGAADPGQGAGATVATSDPPARDPLNTGCIGKHKSGIEDEIDCKLEIWSRRPVRQVNTADAIPDDKRAEYAAAAARQAARRREVSQMGNGSSMGCAQANLGAGCVSDMAIELFVTGPRKAGEPPNGSR